MPAWYPTIAGRRSTKIGEVKVKTTPQADPDDTRTNCGRRRMRLHSTDLLAMS